jgi:hypothetical protein
VTIGSLRLGALSLLAGAWMLGGAPLAGAAETFTVRATVDASRIGLQDTLELQVQVEGAGFTSVEPPDLTRLEEFDVLDGPRRVQRQTIVNGAVSGATQFLWTLAPKHVGLLAIPALGVRVDGKPYRTQRLDLQVVAGTVATRVPAGGRGARGPEAEVLLVGEIDRPRAYVGQQVTFTLKLLTQARIRGVAYQTRPDFNGFWVEREFDAIEDPKGTVEGQPTVREGKSYQEFVLTRIALFPTTSGPHQIDPINVQMRVASDRGGGFGSFFFDREQTILRRTPPLTVDVAPIPAAGRPASFTGAVGSYRMEVSADRAETAVNEAISLAVSIRGDGNLRGAGAPVLPALVDFQPFDPTVEEGRTFRNGILIGSRKWNYVLVPLAPGDQTISPVEFAYFDPDAGAFRTLRSEPVPLRVAKGDRPSEQVAPGNARREVTAVGTDIHFIRLPSGPLEDRRAPFHRSGAFLALLLFPVLVTGALGVWQLRARRLQGDVGRLRARSARRNFRAELRNAEAARRAGRAGEFHAGLSRALTRLVADRGNLSAAGMTRDLLRQALERGGAGGESIAEIEAILDLCDAAQFSRVASAPAEMELLERRAVAAGESLEGAR